MLGIFAKIPLQFGSSLEQWVQTPFQGEYRTSIMVSSHPHGSLCTRHKP